MLYNTDVQFSDWVIRLVSGVITNLIIEMVAAHSLNKNVAVLLWVKNMLLLYKNATRNPTSVQLPIYNTTPNTIDHRIY